MNLIESEKKYKEYIDEHIENVKLVWEDLQFHLKDEFWMDEDDNVSIHFLIETHDQSKYSADEFYGYRQYFYPRDGAKKVESAFNQAWNYHQNHNPHHWEYWLMYEDDKLIALEMPFHYIIEMLCDWTAMSYKFNDDPYEFYLKKKDSMLLAENTKTCLEKYISRFSRLAELHKTKGK